MKILVDADACPSTSLITDVCIEHKLELLLFSDTAHNIESEYGKVFTLDKGFQSVDIAISNAISKGDLLITQDFGLAAIALSKEAYVVHPKGMIYDLDNIDKLLFERYMRIKTRKKGPHIKGPKKRTKEDDYKLVSSLEEIINREVNHGV